MQVIEDMEESVLSTRGGELLYVVHNQDIHLGIEREEVGELVPHNGIHILRLEPVGRNIENNEILIGLLNVNTYGLGDMGLAEAGTSEDEQRVESRAARGHGDGPSGSHCHLVAVSFNEIAETVLLLELRID